MRGQIVETGIGLEAEERAEEAERRLSPRGCCLTCGEAVDWIDDALGYQVYCSDWCAGTAAEDHADR